MAFNDNKIWFTDFFIELLYLLEELNDVIESCDFKNKLLRKLLNEFKSFNLKKVSDSLKVNLAMIERKNMKCVFFGQTSNGKSATINALLEAKVLPSCMGRTTSCFVSIIGYPCDEGYFIDCNGQRKDLSQLQISANELERGCHISSILTVHWPKARCELLKNDVEILDSPGVNYTAANNEFIDRCCEDSDVFVLVIKCENTLNQTDRDFFIKIKEKVGTPNTIVLINQWDLTEGDPELRRENLKSQHVETVTQFFKDDLELSETDDLSERIFFVSAKKKDSYSLKNFKEYLGREMALNAVKIKFKPHIDKTREVLLKVNDLMNDFFVNKSIFESYEVKTRKIESITKDFINEKFEKISFETNKLIETSIPNIINSLIKAVDSGTNLDKQTVEYLENIFPKKMSMIFSEQIGMLDKEIKDSFAQCYGFNITPDQIQVYFNNDRNFFKVVKKYQDDLFSNLKGASHEIRNLSKKQEDSNSFWKSVIENLKIVSGAIVFGGMLLRSVPLLLPLGLFATTIVQSIDEPSNKEIPENLLMEFISFYRTITNWYIEKLKMEVMAITEESNKLFRKHLLEITAVNQRLDTLNNFCRSLLHDANQKFDEI